MRQVCGIVERVGMMNTKYEELQALTKKYGEETSAFCQKVKAIGPKIVEAYADYLGGPKTAGNAVPPDGHFNPRERNNDTAFDSYGRGTIYLEPIRMGICTEIGNLSDHGATWVRTVMEFHPSEAGLRLSVGNRAKQFQVSDNLEAIMGDICEAIFEDAREAFSLELDQAQGRSRIGFIPKKG
jgi:hypothetical protein